MESTCAHMKAAAVMPYSMRGIMKNGGRRAGGRRYPKKGLLIRFTSKGLHLLSFGEQSIVETHITDRRTVAASVITKIQRGPGNGVRAAPKRTQSNMGA
jgi:hypothetical protein